MLFLEIHLLYDSSILQRVAERQHLGILEKQGTNPPSLQMHGRHLQSEYKVAQGRWIVGHELFPAELLQVKYAK